MKTKILIIFLLSLTVGRLYAKAKKEPKLDVDFRYYVIPTVNRIVAGNNTDFSLMNCDTERLSTMHFSCEGRGDIVTVKDFSFSFAMGGESYGDFCENSEDNHTLMSISLGAGVYYNKWNKFSLTGPCLFLYPMYQLPVYYTGGRNECKPLWNWNVALDLGYNFTLLDLVTVYPFFRNILSVNTKRIEYNYDFGVAVGLYFQDKNIKKWNF